MYGGKGEDSFNYNRTWDGEGIIGDYQPGIDRIVLSNILDGIEFEQVLYPISGLVIPPGFSPSLLIKDIQTGKRIFTVVGITDPTLLTIRYAT